MPYERVTVTGVKGFNKPIDGEPSPRSGTIFIEEIMDLSRNDPNEFKFGRASSGYPCGFDNAKLLTEAKFPVVVEVDFERVSDGKGRSKTVIGGIRSVAPATQKAA